MRFQSMLENRFDDERLQHLHLTTSTSSPEHVTACLPNVHPPFERKQHRTQQTKREPMPKLAHDKPSLFSLVQ